MADLVNLRRARKAKLREADEKDAAANRMKYGASKASRDASAAEKARADHSVDSHKIEKN